MIEFFFKIRCCPDQIARCLLRLPPPTPPAPITLVRGIIHRKNSEKPGKSAEGDGGSVGDKSDPSCQFTTGTNHFYGDNSSHRMVGVLQGFPPSTPLHRIRSPDAGYRLAGFMAEWFRDLSDGSNSPKQNIVHDYPAGETMPYRCSQCAGKHPGDGFELPQDHR